MNDIILDCDPGIDDALALIIGLASSKINIHGITTVRGNLSVEKTTENVCRLLSYFNKDIPVAKGSDAPIRGDPIQPAPLHGEDGLGDGKVLPTVSSRSFREDAVTFLIESVNEGISTIVVTGPLTNLALAFERRPETMHELDRIVLMGGAFFTEGNVSPMAEFNFYADPYAADYVIRQSVAKVIIPLNFTRHVLLTEEVLHDLPMNETTRVVKDISQKFMDGCHGKSKVSKCPLHDPLTMAYLLEPDAFTLTPLHLRVESAGTLTRGVCVPERRPWVHKEPNCKVALQGDTNHLLDVIVDLLS